MNRERTERSRSARALIAAAFAVVAVLGAAPHATAGGGSCLTDGPDRLEPEVIEFNKKVHERGFDLRWAAVWPVVLDCDDNALDGEYQVREDAEIGCIPSRQCSGKASVGIQRGPFTLVRKAMTGPIRGVPQGCSDGGECVIETESHVAGSGWTSDLSQKLQFMASSTPNLTIDVVFNELTYHEYPVAA